MENENDLVVAKEPTSQNSQSELAKAESVPSDLQHNKFNDYDNYVPVRSRVEYPNPIADAVVVVGYQSLRVSTFLIRPSTAGFYIFKIWPKYDPNAFRWKKELAFIQDVPRLHSMFPREVLESGGCPPQSIRFSVLDCPKEVQHYELWHWELFPVSKGAPANEIKELRPSVTSIASGTVRFPRQESVQRESKRLIFWSCNQPYKTKVDGTARVNPPTMKILKWYAKHVKKFDPMVIWAMGDTAYADGSKAVNISDAYYNEERDWHNDPWVLAEIREQFRLMFLYHWSFPSFQKVTRNYPHMLVWDDHEIHNGWGSHDKDYRTPNHFETFRAAHDIASEFVFSTGPRLSFGRDSDAHMGFIMDSIAVFGFDIRTSRNFIESRMLSLEQQTVFSKFIMEQVAPNKAVKSLLTFGVVPNYIRSDIRDEWGLPQTSATMEWLIGEMAKLQHIRPDLNFVNLAGDIHVSNAFELHPPNMTVPLYQITSSSLTNREHMIETMRRFLTLKTQTTFPDSRGRCYRLWPDSGKPNFLQIEADGDTLSFTLKVYGKKRYSRNTTDRKIVLRAGRLVDIIA